MLTEQQITSLQALVNCIIPADEYANGWDAGVGDYLLGQFRGDLNDKVGLYKNGLTSLENEAQHIHSKAFTLLSFEEQNALLTNIEKGHVKTGWAIDPVSFFEDVVAHCMEGYYSDPQNGGNRDGISWQMIGFEVSE
jgi:hypothetical protein